MPVRIRRNRVHRFAFHVQATLPDNRDASSFLRRATRLLRDDWLRLHHLERFGGRVSVEGNRLYYHAVIGRKRRNIDDACLRDLN